ARPAAAVRLRAGGGDPPAPRDDVRDLLVQRQIARILIEPVDELQNLPEGVARALRERFLSDDGRGRPPQARARASCLVPHDVDRPRADAARRHVHDALERRIVVAVRDEPQVRERILDLGALEEAHAAVDAIRDAGREQRFLENARLRVRTIQHGDVSTPLSGRDRVLYTIHDELGLVALVERRVDANRLTRAAVGPQVLAETRRVVRDHRVRGIQDRRRGAVVLLEPDDARAGEIALEVLQILDARAAPAVDRLIVVADDERDTALAGDEAEPAVLNRVRVLELVDEEMLEAGSIVLEEIGALRQEFERAEQQLAEIDEPGLVAEPLIASIEIDHAAPARVALVLEVLRAQALVLLGIHEPLHVARRPLVLVEIE